VVAVESRGSFFVISLQSGVKKAANAMITKTIINRAPCNLHKVSPTSNHERVARTYQFDLPLVVI
jgi:hypothetical protein